MTTATLTPGIREGFTTVTPYVWAPDRGLADFLIRVFDAVETSVGDNPGHGTHRELRVGNSMVMIGETDTPPGSGTGRPMAFHVVVDDVDAVFAAAIDAGATSMGAPADHPYGERSGFVRDSYGNHWYIGKPFGPESFSAKLPTLTPFLHAPDAAGYLEFLQRAFGATTSFLHEEPKGHVMYATVRIGSGTLELTPGEAMPGAFFLYVGDVDAWYEQALAAGAKSLAPPAERPANRMAFVEDSAGNHWYIAQPDVAR